MFPRSRDIRCAQPTQAAGRHLKLGGFLNRFAREEDGAMLVFGIYVFLLILMVGGIGIDLMRFERDRSELQYTLDRAVLAAADLDQTLPPTEVVTDYLTKAGLEQYISSVTVTQGVGFRNVAATANADIQTQFMHMGGVDTLTAPAASMAEESIGHVEVSLVLDISGSMNSNNRLTYLKTAANNFVDELLGNTEPGSVSISIIPFATQVNAGEALLGKYTVTNEHNYSHCVNFIANEFSKSTLSRYDILERTAHFDPFTYSEDPISMPVCPTRAGSEILPLSNHLPTLHAYINGLTAGGNTSTDIGMKWGVTLLDPATRSVINDLVADGEINPDFKDRPGDYNTDVSLKIAVLMADGQNTDQYMLNPSLRTGDSNVWYNAEEGEYSIRHDSSAENYYWPQDEDWHDHPYGNDSGEPGNAVRMTFPELFAQVSLAWNAEYNYEFTRSAWADWYTSAKTKLNSVAKDQQTKHICDATKDQGIIVYSVGLDVSKRGGRLLRACASSGSHYFDSQGSEITDAFSAIASSIRKLRLTQ